MTTKSEQQPLIRDEANYRALCEPHPSADAANEALEAFFAGVRELRNRHRIREAYVICKLSALGEDGQEGEYIIGQHNGSSLEGEGLTAWAFGHEQAQRQERVSRILGAESAIRRREPRK